MKKFKGSQSLSNVIVVPVIHPESYHMFAHHKQKEDDMYLYSQNVFRTSEVLPLQYIPLLTPLVIHGQLAIRQHLNTKFEVLNF